MEENLIINEKWNELYLAAKKVINPCHRDSTVRSLSGIYDTADAGKLPHDRDYDGLRK